MRNRLIVLDALGHLATSWPEWHSRSSVRRHIRRRSRVSWGAAAPAGGIARTSWHAGDSGWPPRLSGRVMR